MPRSPLSEQQPSKIRWADEWCWIKTNPRNALWRRRIPQCSLLGLQISLGCHESPNAKVRLKTKNACNNMGEHELGSQSTAKSLDLWQQHFRLWHCSSACRSWGQRTTRMLNASVNLTDLFSQRAMQLACNPHTEPRPSCCWQDRICVVFRRKWAQTVRDNQ